VDLNVYRWKNRLLVVFSPSQDHSDYQSLIKEMQDQRNGLRERDVLVFEILEKGESRFGKTVLKKEAIDFLRQKISAGQEFIPRDPHGQGWRRKDPLAESESHGDFRGY